MHKSRIRAAALQQRKSLSQHQRNSFSQQIIASLLQFLSAQTTQSECLLMYRSMSSEVITDALLPTTDYRIFAPVTPSDTSMQWRQVSPETDWKRGVFGVLEPQHGDIWHQQCGVTTLLCPLSAFDRQGNRLGMGKGCFDTWLSQYGAHIQQVIGLAFSCQQVAQMPIEAHDMPMHYVITEQEVITCGDTL